MYQKLLRDSRFFMLLSRCDKDLAAEAQKRGCACGGKLHSARYPRKPRGLPDDEHLAVAYQKRHSFCCDREGCRQRMTPPSVCFLGRKVYVGVAVILVSALQHGPTPTRLAKLREWIGVSSRTVARWRRWWQETFVQSPFWQAARGRLQAPVDLQCLPWSLLQAFAARSAGRKLLASLCFLRPVTTAPGLHAF